LISSYSSAWDTAWLFTWNCPPGATTNRYSASGLAKYWTAEFAAAFRPHADAGLVAARVGAQHRGVYVLYGEHGELRAESAGRLRRGAGPADLPAVGDWVAASVLADGRAMVHAVLPRRTKLSRKATGLATEEQVVAANADLVFLVCGLVPDPSPRRLERHLAAVWESGAEPVVVLTKTDLCEDARAWATDVEAIASGAPVHAISNVTGEGGEELRRLLGSRTAALLGLSGAGKSSLVNRLAGEEVLAVQELRADGRGRHTTTHRELVLLPGGGLLLRQLIEDGMVRWDEVHRECQD